MQQNLHGDGCLPTLDLGTLSDPESGVGSALGGRENVAGFLRWVWGRCQTPRSGKTDWFLTRDLGASSDPESGFGSVLSSDLVLLVISRIGSGAMPAPRSRRNGRRLRDAGTRHPMPKHMDQPPDPETDCGRQGCIAVWSSLPARRQTRDIARHRPVLKICALAVSRLCADSTTRCQRMRGSPDHAHGRHATSRGVGPYENEAVSVPRVKGRALC